MCSLLIIRNILNVNFSVYLLVAVLALLSLTFNRSEMLAAIVLVAPFENAFPVTIYYAIMLCIYIIKRNFKLRLNIFIMPIFFLGIFELAHYYVKPFSFIQYFKLFMTYSFVGILIFDNTNDVKYGKILKWFVIGAFLFCSLVFFKEWIINDYSVSNLFQSSKRLGDYDINNNLIRNYNLYNNPNAIGLICNMAIASILIMLQINKQTLGIWMLLFILLSIYGFMTLSKTFIIILILQVLFVCGIFLRRIKEKGYLERTLFLIISLAFLSVYSIINMRFYLIKLINRFTTDLLSHRGIIFQAYNSFMFEKLERILFGVGIQSINTKAGLLSNPHNMLQEVFVAWGIVGLIITSVIVLSIYKYSVKNNWKPIPIAHLPFLTLLLATQTSRLFRKPEAVVLFIVVFCTYRYFQIEQITKTSEEKTSYE